MRKWYPAILIMLAFVVSAVAFPRLPDRVPTHWNLHGQIDAYGPRSVGLFLMPLVVLGIWGLMRARPKIDPLRENYAKMHGAYDIVVNAAVTVMAVIHLAIVAAM